MINVSLFGAGLGLVVWLDLENEAGATTNYYYGDWIALLTFVWYRFKS